MSGGVVSGGVGERDWREVGRGGGGGGGEGAVYSYIAISSAGTRLNLSTN